MWQRASADTVFGRAAQRLEEMAQAVAEWSEGEEKPGGPIIIMEQMSCRLGQKHSSGSKNPAMNRRPKNQPSSTRQWWTWCYLRYSHSLEMKMAEIEPSAVKGKKSQADTSSRNHDKKMNT